MHNIELLKRLEEIYKIKFELEEREVGIPKYLRNKKNYIEELKKNLENIQGKYEEYVKEDIKLKLDIQDINFRRGKTEEKIDSIKTQREYEALEKELQIVIDEEVAIRKKMGYVTGLKAKLGKEISEINILLSEEELLLKEQQAKLQVDLKDVTMQLEKIQEEESKLSEQMNEDFLFKFERIIKNKSNGIIPLIDNVCRGCYMMLPLEFANKVRKTITGVNFCPYCSRILYYQDQLGESEKIIPGSLADLVE